MKKYLVSFCDIAVTVLIMCWLNTLIPMKAFSSFITDYPFGVPVVVGLVVFLIVLIFTVNLVTAKKREVSKRYAFFETLLILITVFTLSYKGQGLC